MEHQNKVELTVVVVRGAGAVTEAGGVLVVAPAVDKPLVDVTRKVALALQKVGVQRRLKLEKKYNERQGGSRHRRAEPCQRP